MTDKPTILRILMLLSALESWSFSNGVNSRLPDHTLEELNALVDELKQSLLK